MATGNDKNQSPIIAHRLPEFIQTDHPTMVAFIQAYYEWLDQQASQGYVRTPAALDGLTDVDETIDEFVAAFKKEYLLGFPEEFAVSADGNSVDVRQLVKNIKDFYRNKGTEKTYEFLFRVLYDTAVEFYYPSRDILRLSDGKWIQKYSIRCSNDLGSKISEARGKTIVQRSIDGSVIASARVIDVTVYQIGSRQVSELFLSNINGKFRANTDAINNYGGIEFADNNGVLQQETRIYPVLSAVSVSSQGSNYRKGDRIFFQPSITPYRQNLLRWSNAIGDTAKGWGYTTAVMDPPILNATTAPDGSSTATKLTVVPSTGYPNNNGNGFAFLYFTNQITFDGTPKTITLSAYIKAVDASNKDFSLWLATGNSGPEIRMSLVTASAKSGITPASIAISAINYAQITQYSPTITHTNASSTITDVGNGWARVSLTVTINNAVAGTVARIGLFPRGPVANGSIYVWGAQVNEGSSVLPYLKTESIVPLSVAATNDTGQGAAATIIDVDGNGGILKTRIDNFGVGYEIAPIPSFDSVFGSGGAVTTTLGTLCTYPGYYSNNDGRLSTNKVMQDNHYYQNFSYVLLTEVVIDRYKDILRRLIHPAGMGMFGRVVVNRCATEPISTDALAKKTDANTTIGNYSPYTLYTYRDMGSLFFNGRSLPYIPSIDNATITGAGGNPTGLTGLTSAHYQVSFSPKDITGLKIWLDGKTLTGAAGATVGAWADSSGNGFTASASLQNLYPTVSDMGGLRLTGSVGTFGSVLTTPSLTGALNQRSLFVAFTPMPVMDNVNAPVISQQNCVVVGLMRGQGEGYTAAATGQYYQHHSVCVDYSRTLVDFNTTHPIFEPALSLTPRIAAYYGLGNHPGLTSVYASDATGNDYSSANYATPRAGLSLRVNNMSSVVYSAFGDDLSSLTAANPNTSIVSSILAEGDPSLTAAAYSYLTEVKKFDKKSNNDLTTGARYYRYQKMAEFTATEDGSYNFSMEMKRDSGTQWAFKGIISKNDGVVESSSLSTPNVPNQIAQWQESSMSDGNGAGSWTPTSYKVHTVSVKDIKAGDVIRVWMSPSYNSGSKPPNSSLDTTKALYLKNFVVNKIYSQGKNFLTVNGTERGTAIANLKGITQGQRLTIGLGQNFFNGVVHEVLVYDRALTQQERQIVEAYLYKRWKGSIIPAANHPWNLPAIDSLTAGIYPVLPTEGGYTAHSMMNTKYGYPFFTISNHPNIELALEEQPYAARILASQYSDFLGGGTGAAGYWAEWAEGSTANRQNWASSLTAAGSRHALLNYSTSSEFRKITAEAFLDRKVGLQFDCKNEAVVDPLVPQVRLNYSANFVGSTVYSNGTILFNYTIANANNMDYWTTDLMEVEISDGRKFYRYRPEAPKWKKSKAGNFYGEFSISGFTSEGIGNKSYLVAFRMKNYYGKVIPGSEDTIQFAHRYANLPLATDSMGDGTNLIGYTPDPNEGEGTTPSFRFGTELERGTAGGTLLPEGFDPVVWQEYWKDKIKERDTWFWRIGEGDTLPFDLGDCDPLGIRAFWRPGSSPFALPENDYFRPAEQLYPPGGPNYHIPSDVPPDDLTPLYVNDENGQEIYYYDNHWWIRTPTGNGDYVWSFRLRTNDEDFVFSGTGWSVFYPCYGVPVCFPEADGQYPLYSPFILNDGIEKHWHDPFKYPPGYFELNPDLTTYPGIYKPVSNPYSVPNDNPAAPFSKTGGWRPASVQPGVDQDGNPYYGRGWDPILGPTYISPDDGIMPSNPDFIGLRKRPPCKNNAPGIDIEASIAQLNATIASTSSTASEAV